jgi:hypothetical protein
VSNLFPPLPLAEWQSTRDLLQGYARVAGRIRRLHTPTYKHWWHVCLYATATGLTTTPMATGVPDDDRTFELLLDLIGHQMVITSSHGDWFEIDFDGQSPTDLCQEVIEALSDMDIRLTSGDQGLDCAEFGRKPAVYDAGAVENFWQALSQIDLVFKQFKAGLRQESGPVVLWPHHFDLAVLWFSGRLVPGQDPANAEYADEQMNFGFSTGDDTIPEPYFYATAYPAPEGWMDAPLPAGANWHTEGWQGAVLPYQRLVEAGDPRAELLDFLQTAHQAGSSRMN